MFSGLTGETRHLFVIHILWLTMCQSASHTFSSRLPITSLLWIAFFLIAFANFFQSGCSFPSPNYRNSYIPHRCESLVCRTHRTYTWLLSYCHGTCDWWAAGFGTEGQVREKAAKVKRNRWKMERGSLSWVTSVGWGQRCVEEKNTWLGEKQINVHSLLTAILGKLTSLLSFFYNRGDLMTFTLYRVAI